MNFIIVIAMWFDIEYTSSCIFLSLAQKYSFIHQEATVFESTFQFPLGEDIAALREAVHSFAQEQIAPALPMWIGSTNSPPTYGRSWVTWA